MPKHGTASVSGPYIEFQNAVLRALPRKIPDELALSWAGNGKGLQHLLLPLLANPTPIPQHRVNHRKEAVRLYIRSGFNGHDYAAFGFLKDDELDVDHDTMIERTSDKNSSLASGRENDFGRGRCFPPEELDGVVFVTKERLFKYNSVRQELDCCGTISPDTRANHRWGEKYLVLRRLNKPVEK